MKPTKKGVINWIIAMLLANLGVCLCTKASFGLSMIGASPYIIHVWLRDSFPWFTQGTAEYVWEAIVLVIGCLIMRQFKWRYLLSFVVAILAGLFIDGWFIILGGNGMYEGMPLRIFAFVAGTLLTSCGIAFFFHSDMPLQVYELNVAEISAKYAKDLNKVKFINDMILLAIAVILSLVLTHGFTGIGVGTIIITVINAPLIGFFRKIVDKIEQ